MPSYKRPWQTPVPPLSDAVEKVVRFPTEDEESGSVLLGFRGPICSDRYGMTALSVILDYLTDTPIAPLQRDLVEIPDPFCSDISCDILEYLESCLVIKAKNVPFVKLNATKEKIKQVLGNLAEGKEVIDMSRMGVVIHRKILDTKNNFENHPHDTFADAIVGDFLYSTRAEDLHSRLGIIQDLEKLQKETVDYWVAVLKNYFSKSSSSVVVSTCKELQKCTYLLPTTQVKKPWNPSDFLGMRSAAPRPPAVLLKSAVWESLNDFELCEGGKRGKSTRCVPTILFGVVA